MSSIVVSMALLIVGGTFMSGVAFVRFGRWTTAITTASQVAIVAGVGFMAYWLWHAGQSDLEASILIARTIAVAMILVVLALVAHIANTLLSNE